MKKVIKALPVMLAAALLFSGCAAKPGEDPTIATPPSEEQSFEIDTGLIGNPLYGNRVKLQSFGTESFHAVFIKFIKFAAGFETFINRNCRDSGAFREFCCCKPFFG